METIQHDGYLGSMSTTVAVKAGTCWHAFQEPEKAQTLVEAIGFDGWGG